MQYSRPKIKSGFTLIELLIVIAIIGVLSSIVLTNINSARAKSRDAKVKQEFNSVKTALTLYYDKYNRYPNEVSVNSNPWVDNFNSMAQQLVSEGFLAGIPVAPQNHTYNYYNYLSGSAPGAILVTTLESAAPSTVGYSGTCRPFPAGTNWCDQASTNYYCICNPH